MSPHRSHVLAPPAWSLLAGLALHASAAASPVATPLPAAPPTVASAKNVEAPRSPAPTLRRFAAKAVHEFALDGMRGGTETFNSNVSNGTVNNTSAVNVATGNNSISDGAFTNSTGLPTVIQNSGANVLIQNSTIINLQFQK